MSAAPHIHIAGVGGVGMSALAELLLALGYRVTGSDRTLDQGGHADAVECLVRAGLQVYPQNGSGLTSETRSLAVSTAIEPDNADVLAAQRLGVEVVHRATLLARLAEGRRVIAIAGTAGKTTVTALVGWVLEQGGFDPTVVNGGIVLNWRRPARLGNVRLGTSDWWVLELDESDRSLLRFHPSHALVTNISKDHFELDDVRALFRQFVGQVSGVVVTGPGVSQWLDRAALEPAIRLERSGGIWRIGVDGAVYETRLPGRHNAENAALAAALCRELGVGVDDIRDALARFRGVHRRLEVVGMFRGARVIDDYAHNPIKIAASWRAAAEAGGRVLGWWRPHGFAPLALMRDELVDILATAMAPEDRIFVLPVYYAGGTTNRVVSSDDLVEIMRARGVGAELVRGYDDLFARLSRETRAGDTLLGMGARDPELPRFARRLVSGAV